MTELWWEEILKRKHELLDARYQAALLMPIKEIENFGYMAEQIWAQNNLKNV